MLGCCYYGNRSKDEQRPGRPLSSATCPPIFMQLSGQNNGGTASSAFLLARKGN